MMFGQKVAGLAAVFGKPDNVFLPTQRFFHQLSIQWRIVCHQDLELLWRSAHMSSGGLFGAGQKSTGTGDSIPQLVGPPRQRVKRAVAIDSRLNWISPAIAHRRFQFPWSRLQFRDQESKV